VGGGFYERVGDFVGGRILFAWVVGDVVVVVVDDDDDVVEMAPCAG